MSETTLTIRLTDEVAAELERVAREDGLSPEREVESIITRRMQAIRSAADFFAERGKNADWGAFDRVFGSHRKGGEPPRPGDEIE